jgi:hypothetical protein
MDLEIRVNNRTISSHPTDVRKTMKLFAYTEIQASPASFAMQRRTTSCSGFVSAEWNEVDAQKQECCLKHIVDLYPTTGYATAHAHHQSVMSLHTFCKDRFARIPNQPSPQISISELCGQ